MRITLALSSAGFDGVRGIETELSWLDPSGKPQRIALKVGNYRSVRLSPDGKKIALALSER